MEGILGKGSKSGAERQVLPGLTWTGKQKGDLKGRGTQAVVARAWEGPGGRRGERMANGTGLQLAVRKNF